MNDENDDIGRKFNVNFQNLLEQLKRPAIDAGWVEITADTDQIMKKFCELYDFTPSTNPKDWPGIKEPVPSVTFTIDHYFPVYDSKVHYESEVEKGRYPTTAILALGEFYKSCFRNVLRKGDQVIVLDWFHPWYMFDPWSEFDHWEILPVPDGDYYIFLTPDLKGGFFGHPWEGTICVIGEHFVSQLGNAPEDLLRFPVRRDGKWL